MKRLIAAFMFVILAFSFGCERGGNNSDKVNWSISKHSDATERDYEETPDGYKAAFYAIDEIYVDKITDWIDTCDKKGEYYEYIYSDPDSWDMYLYCKTDIEEKYGKMKFGIEDSCMKVYVESGDAADVLSKRDYVLVRIQAPQRGAWPATSQLYIDGSAIPLHNT